MSLQHRAQQLGRERQQNLRGPLTDPSEQVKQPITLTAGRELFAIVDGELVNVIGATDIPGMSPAYWCSDNQGHSAPVSFRDARIFTNAQQALQVLEQERGGIQNSPRR